MILAATLNDSTAGLTMRLTAMFFTTVVRIGPGMKLRPSSSGFGRYVQKIDKIFGLEKSIHESTKSDENVTRAAPFRTDFLLRIRDIKQPLQSGCGHKMGNTNCGSDWRCLFSFMLEVKGGEGKCISYELVYQTACVFFFGYLCEFPRSFA